MISGQVTIEDIVNLGLKVNPKPHWIKVPKGKIWCPNCNRIQRLKRAKYLGVRRCEGCGVTEREYYTKKYNGLGRF